MIEERGEVIAGCRQRDHIGLIVHANGLGLTIAEEEEIAMASWKCGEDA